MHPILIELGPIEIRFYGLMYVTAILFASFIIKREVKRKGIGLTNDDIMNFIVCVVLGGIIVARIYYVVFNMGYYISEPKEIIAIWHGGLAIHGGIIGGLLGGFIFLKRKGIAFWKMADIVALTLILGQAFGRFGNFMNGDAHGMPTDMPWGLVFPPTSIAGSEFPGVPLHPTMLYELIINLSIFCFLWFFVKKVQRRDGFIFALYITLYSAGRFVVETFRADSLMLGPLKVAQVLSITLIISAVAVMIAMKLWVRVNDSQVGEARAS